MRAVMAGTSVLRSRYFATRGKGYSHMVLHDVDQLPENPANSYGKLNVRVVLGRMHAHAAQAGGGGGAPGDGWLMAARMLVPWRRHRHIF